MPWNEEPDRRPRRPRLRPKDRVWLGGCARRHKLEHSTGDGSAHALHGENRTAETPDSRDPLSFRTARCCALAAQLHVVGDLAEDGDREFRAASSTLNRYSPLTQNVRISGRMIRSPIRCSPSRCDVRRRPNPRPSRFRVGQCQWIRELASRAGSAPGRHQARVVGSARTKGSNPTAGYRPGFRGQTGTVCAARLDRPWRASSAQNRSGRFRQYRHRAVRCTRLKGKAFADGTGAGVPLPRPATRGFTWDGAEIRQQKPILQSSSALGSERRAKPGNPGASVPGFRLSGVI